MSYAGTARVTSGALHKSMYVLEHVTIPTQAPEIECKIKCVTSTIEVDLISMYLRITDVSDNMARLPHGRSRSRISEGGVLTGAFIMADCLRKVTTG